MPPAYRPRLALPRVHRLAGALVSLSIVGFLPFSARPAQTLLMAAGVLGAAVGLPLLAELVRSGDRTAVVGAAVAGWAAVSAVASGEPLAWTGEYFTGTGAIFIAAAVAYWSLGRAAPATAVEAVRWAFLAGACVNAIVAIGQGLLDLEAIDLPLNDERATGLLGNSIFLGAVCAAAVGLLPSLGQRSRNLVLVVAALLAAATQLSGSRISLAVLGALGIWAATRCPRRHGFALVAVLALGVIAGTALHRQDAATTATDRLQTASGLEARLENWRAGADAAIDQPVTGYGPGRWRAATAPRQSLELARLEGGDTLYADAHNLPIEYAATTGVIGASLVVVWLLLIGLDLRGTRHPEMVAAAAGLLAYHLVEPQHLTLTPLMLMLAGAAAGQRVELPRRRLRPAAIATLLVIALGLSARMIAGDLLYRSADTDFALDRMQTASSLLWPWPNPINAEARIHAFEARTEKVPSKLRLALRAALRARDREPSNPLRTVAVASFLGQLGDHQAAANEYAAAAQLNPWSVLALRGRATELDVLGRDSQAMACRRATRLASASDRELRSARADCLSTGAKRERP